MSNLIALESITVDFFKPFLNQPFDLYYGGAGPEKLELITVSEGHARQSKPGSRSPFSLIFRAGNPQFYVPQGIMGLQNDQTGGRLEIFLVPIGPDDVGMQFQAVFN